MSARPLSIILALGTTQTLAWASSLLSAGDPGRSDRARSRRLLELDLCRLLRIAGDLGAARPAHRPADRSGRRPVGAVDVQPDARGRAGAARLHLFDPDADRWPGCCSASAWPLASTTPPLPRSGASMARRRDSSITGITLIAGFASTVGWPLIGDRGWKHIGWRNTCFAWAAAHILIGLPINLVDAAAGDGREGGGRHRRRSRTFRSTAPWCLLAFAFAAAWTVTGAMAAHLPRIMEAAGATTAQAVLAGALIGPAQVAARIFEAGFLSRYHPLVSTRLACLTHPIGAADRRPRRRRRGQRVRDFPRRRQRHPDDCARHAAARDLRSAELRLSPRHHRRAGADGAGCSTAAVQPVDRHHGQPRPDGFLRAQPRLRWWRCSCCATGRPGSDV